MSTEREYASKGVAGAGLGTGIGGVVTGVPALILSAMNWIRENNKPQAALVAAQAGMTLADIVALMDKFDNRGGQPYGYGMAPVPMMGGCQPYGYGGVPMMGGCNEQVPATRFDIQQSEKMEALRSENASLRSEKYSDANDRELYEFIRTELNKRDDRFLDFKDNTTAQFQQIAVYQATNTAGIACLKGQVDGLSAAFDGLTEVVVPQRHVFRGAPQRVVVTNTESNPVNVSED